MSGPLFRRPGGHTSVMAHREATAPDDLDYFPTPPWAARAGGELIAALDPGGPWSCWEPACGGGHMAHGLGDYFGSVLGSDLHAHGSRWQTAQADFLNPIMDGWLVNGEADWIVTNPPFKHGEAFVRTAYRRARRGVAMLLRLVFLEGGARYRMYQDLPLACVAPFAERVPMVKGRWDPEASSATAYAWFVWLKPGVGPDRPAEPVVRFIPPGSKTRLEHASDRTLFAPGPEPEAGLFDDEGGEDA